MSLVLYAAINYVLAYDLEYCHLKAMPKSLPYMRQWVGLLHCLL